MPNVCGEQLRCTLTQRFFLRPCANDATASRVPFWDLWLCGPCVFSKPRLLYLQNGSKYISKLATRNLDKPIRLRDQFDHQYQMVALVARICLFSPAITGSRSSGGPLHMPDRTVFARIKFSFSCGNSCRPQMKIEPKKTKTNQLDPPLNHRFSSVRASARKSKFFKSQSHSLAAGFPQTSNVLPNLLPQAQKNCTDRKL